MQTFNVRNAWTAERDVRNVQEFADHIAKSKPNGLFWTLIAARRAGKTWTLRALEAHFNASGQPGARYFGLRKTGRSAPDGRPAFNKGKFDEEVLLIDEPELEGDGAERHAKDLLKKFEAYRNDGKKIFLAAAPAEWDCLRKVDEAGNPNVDANDIQSLEPLNGDQVETISSREGWAKTLATMLPKQWKRNPFLLEAILSIAEQQADLRDSARQTELIRNASAWIKAEFSYIEKIYASSLNDAHKQTLRSVARCEITDAVDAETRSACVFLSRSGLLNYVPANGQAEIADPLLAEYLPPPLRIHHVSDVHVGVPKKTAMTVDQKAGGKAGETLGKAAGQGRVIDEYLKHLRTRKRDKPHILVVSGDVAEHGLEDHYSEVADWFVSVRNELAPEHCLLADDADRVLIVGGNHDVHRGNADASGTLSRHQPFAAAFAAFPRPMLEVDPESRPLTTVNYPEAGVEFVLLGSAELGQEIDDADQNVVMGLLNKARDFGLPDAERTKVINELKNDNRIDPGLIHHQQLQKMRELGPADKNKLRIAVLHHHVSPMPQGVEVARFAGLLNAGMVKDACFATRVGLILHGHMHAGWFAIESWPGQHDDWHLRIAAAATLGSSETYDSHGFNEIVVYREGEEIQVEVIRYKRSGATWSPACKMGPFRPGMPVDYAS